MIRTGESSAILFLSTYPPRKCGIASFTQDLVNAITDEMGDNAVVRICALDKEKNKNNYDPPVTMVMNGHDIDSCMEAATKINNDDSIKLICIEHEFGLYGGEMGEYLIGFLSLLEKPVIIRFHTVLPKPDEKRLRIVQTISLLTEKVIVMTKHAASLLGSDYRIPGDKIMIIPHGTHNAPVTDQRVLKYKYDLANKLVLTNFGLLSPNKGLEKAILAMKKISAEFPQAIYLIIGQTHPNLLESEGERYREHLQQMINESGLQENVRIVNEYVPTETLMEYLTLTDIYLFTSKDPNQAMSGTFLYAMSAGCPIISNLFVLAKEMLDEDTGIILETNEADELAQHAIWLLQNDELRRKMGVQAFLRTRDTVWKKVAAKHTGLFYEIMQSEPPMPAVAKQFIS